MIRNELADLTAFATIAEERSFVRAATRLGVSQSALSHSMRGLEKRLGIQLLARTTRSVAATAAGSALLVELAPALERIERAVAETRQQKDTPSGRIRIVIPRTATKMVIMPKLAQFARTYPEITLEITHSNDPVDLIAGGYDAGVQLGEFIQRDMIAVRVTGEMRLAVLDGVGIGTSLEASVRKHVAEGRLIQVLQDWCAPFPGYYLYYPSRRNQPAALAALINALRWSE
jgi:DNA-binding transcriptional LysR family regulator